MTTEDVMIVGAGPSGTAAAIQLRRHGVSPVVFERKSIGGLLREAWRVENYPGFPDGLAGVELIELLARHLERAGVDPVFEEVVSLDHSDGLFEARTPGRTVRSRTAIVASGTRPRPLEDVTVDEAVADRVLREIHSLSGISGSRVAIVGSGDAAFDYALSLCRANDVVLMIRSDSSKCLPVLRQRVEEEGVEILWGAAVASVSTGQGRPLNLACRFERDVRVEADHVVFAVGREPSDSFFTDRLRAESSRLVAAGDLALVGDVSSGIYRQAAIACGHGVLAAMKIAGRLGEMTR